jgi:hypothetical protein
VNEVGKWVQGREGGDVILTEEEMLAKSPIAAQRGMSGLYGAIPDAKTFREFEAAKGGRTISVRAGIS